MANPRYQLLTTAATYVHIPDFAQSPFNLSYVVEVPGGVTISYTVLYTVDDVNDLTWTPLWLADITNAGAQTATKAGFYTDFNSGPIRGLEVIVASISGGNARFAVLQGSSAR